ncbi:MAG TPA: adenine phosphoribosyltransferase [Vicinamibacteria bacterium]|jgi:adenine phosphoribosyltransferase|nr:adenine phosphoribosyltransferase [Vicinamibacteria bacterium]
MDLQADIDSLKAAIRDVPDFPKKGIVFKDITTLLKDPVTFRRAVDLFVVLCGGERVDKVVAIESRGFILGSLVASRLGAGFVPVRKPGKLPARTVKATYDLEYGTDSLEIHEDAVSAGERVLIVDDVIATGGTARAVGDLTKKLGGIVAAYAFLVELTFLNGREKLMGYRVNSLIRY